ncbi:MAG: hypothetical protein H7839_10040 [Magnetococcus sp. YQC-5]
MALPGSVGAAGAGCGPAINGDTNKKHKKNIDENNKFIFSTHYPIGLNSMLRIATLWVIEYDIDLPPTQISGWHVYNQ